jgi:hypothetical protein
LEQRVKPTSRMACRRSFVGSMLWITLNRLTSIASAAHVAWSFAHTRSQSVVGYIIIMRMFLGGLVVSLIIRSVSYTFALKVRGASPCFGGSTYALSMAYIRKYSSLLGIPLTWGGCPLCVCVFEKHSHWAVISPSRRLCTHVRYIKSYLHFVFT